MKTELDKFKTRWRRWLGNKTRANRPDWVTLLDSNWLGWIEQVFTDCGESHSPIWFTSTREEVKEVYSRAIDIATMRHLALLDNLYAQDRWMK